MPSRCGQHIVRSDFFVKSHFSQRRAKCRRFTAVAFCTPACGHVSFCRSSLPNRIRYAGLRFGFGCTSFSATHGTSEQASYRLLRLCSKFRAAYFAVSPFQPRPAVLGSRLVLPKYSISMPDVLYYNKKEGATQCRTANYKFSTVQLIFSSLQKTLMKKELKSMCRTIMSG